MAPRLQAAPRTKVSVVLTYGTFDLLHLGHLRLLKRASNLGDKLIVGVSTDRFNHEKCKRAAQPYWLRAWVIKKLRYVDKIIAERSWDQKVKDIKKHKVDILVMGSDWKGKFDDLPCKVIYLDRTEGVSSAELREWAE